MKKFLIILLFLIPAILVAIWFRDGKMLAGAEDGIPLYNTTLTINLYKTAWIPASLGSPNATLVSIVPFYYFASSLAKLGIPLFLIQAIVFFSIMATSGLSVFFLSRLFFNKFNNPDLIGFLAAIFYLLNPFTFLSIWQRFVYAFYFQLAILPCMLLFFVLGLTKNKYYFIVPFCLVSLIFSGTFVTPILVIMIFSVIFFYLLFYVWENKKDYRKIIFAITFFILSATFWFLTNSWWLIFLFNQGPAKYSELVTTTGNIQSLMGVSKNQGLIHIVRLINATNLFKQKLWGEIYSSLLFQLISFIIPSIIIATLLVFRKKVVIKFIFILTLFSLFVSNGANLPLGSIFVFFFKNVSILQGFRNPFEKYGIVLALCYSLLFGVGMAHFIRYLKKRFKNRKIYLIPLTICALIFIVYIYPMWNGQVFGGKTVNYKIEVPDYYERLASYLKNSDERIISIPFITGGGVRYLWPNSYQGTPPDEFLLPVSEISGASFLPINSQAVITNMWESLYTKDFWKMMHLTSSRYLLLHRDINSKFSNYASYDYVKKFLSVNQRPNDLTKLSLSPCTSWERFSDKPTNQTWLRCKIPEKYQDWTDLSYLHIVLYANLDGKISFHASSKDYVDVFWGDLPQYIYSYSGQEVGKEKEYVLSLKSARNRYSNFDFSKVDYFYVTINSHSPITQQAEIEIRKNLLDKGIDKKVENISFDQQFGDLKLYKLDEKYVLPKIYTSSTLKMVNNIDEMLVNFDTNFVPLDIQSYVTKDQDNISPTEIAGTKFNKPEISYSKINPTLYNVSIKNSKGPFLVIFNETYDPGWQLFTGTDKTGKHFRANGYANGYLVDKNGDFDMKLEYEPQKYLTNGFNISLLGYVGLIPFLLITSFLQKKSVKS